MMPACVVAAPAAAPGSSYGGGGGVVEPQEKYDCFAGNGFTVAFGVAIFLTVVAHCCISFLAGFLRNWRCDATSPTREERNLMRWMVGLHYITLGLLVVVCIFIGAGGVPKYETVPDKCGADINNNNTTAVYHAPGEKRVCTKAWLPLAGGGAIFFHGVAGFFYAFIALGIVVPPGSGRRQSGRTSF